MTKFKGRILELGSGTYAPMFHDLIKTLTVIGVIEFAQRYVLEEKYVDGVYIYIMLFVMAGQILFHLLIDKIIGAGGPKTMCCGFLGLMEKSGSSRKQTADGGDQYIPEPKDMGAYPDTRQEDTPSKEAMGEFTQLPREVDTYVPRKTVPKPLESLSSWWS